MIKTCTVEQDEITKAVGKMFDYDFDGTIQQEIIIPEIPKDFQIGVIFGSSGSGKSTILNEIGGGTENVEWDESKAIISHFKDMDEGSRLFGAVGLNSVPTWLKPYHVLSTGEKFRANMARMLKSGACIDEFTSVVNRETAISCSNAMQKYIRKFGLERIVLASCHDDIIPYLKPDWIYNTDTSKFYNGRYLRRPKMEIVFHRVTTKEWDMFKKHHYLTSDINKASNCFIGEINGQPVVFHASMSMPGRDVKHAFRGHRLVVLPDYQGLGIGTMVSDLIGQAYIEKGCRYFEKTANPRLGEYHDRSPLWKATSNNHSIRSSYIKRDGTARVSDVYGMKPELILKHAKRWCYSHEYIGDGTIYPYTYNDQIQLEGQISMFD